MAKRNKDRSRRESDRTGSRRLSRRVRRDDARQDSLDLDALSHAAVLDELPRPSMHLAGLDALKERAGRRVDVGRPGYIIQAVPRKAPIGATIVPRPSTPTPLKPLVRTGRDSPPPARRSAFHGVSGQTLRSEPVVKQSDSRKRDDRLNPDTCKERPEPGPAGSGGGVRRDFVPWCERR